jgi:hypothetical protein
MPQAIPRSASREANRYVRALLALEGVHLKREERYDRFVRPLDPKRDAVAGDIATGQKALSGSHYAEARRRGALSKPASQIGSPPAVASSGDGGRSSRPGSRSCICAGSCSPRVKGNDIGRRSANRFGNNDGARLAVRKLLLD